MANLQHEQRPYLAPGASGYASLVLPGANQPRFPPVSEHVVEPETWQEMIDGQVMQASPAYAPHADEQFRIAEVLGPSVAPGYVGTTELLTRTSDQWNFAADVAIRKEGVDPATGQRYLEELAFEVKYTQSMHDITARARQLANRGVRRVFMICVHAKEHGNHDEPGPAGPMMEWSPADDAWIALAPDALIEDPCLHHPIRVRALLDAAEAEESIAQALLVKDNPVIERAIEEAQTQADAQGYERGQSEGYEQGRAQVLRETILDMCELLDIALTPERRGHIEALDAGGLSALRDRLKAHRRWDP